MPTQDARFRELCSIYDAVSRTELPGGYLVLAATGPDGTVQAVEVLDRAGDPLENGRAVSVLGTARRHALELADRTTDLVVNVIALQPDDEVNLSKIARETGIARQTLYTRLTAAA
jgi:transcriptional regulator of acetoin/glycerol metabolism